MKLPRDLDGEALVKALASLGYERVRQSGSHVRLHCEIPKPHALTVPLHSPLKLGTLSAILADVAAQRGVSREELLRVLFGS